uniref:Uncharacterized protein n=1 Tax=Canis lupus familiaris TaxID=9615 RepID=A0A8C0SQM4_CANLF
MPLRGPSDACFTTFLMSSYLAAFSRRQVRSTTDTLGVGTRKAMPVSLPFSSGMTLPTALAVPVEARDDVLGSPSAVMPQLPRGAVHGLLGGSDGMDGGREALHDAEVVILLMVHAHHKHAGISRRSRDDDPLGPALQVSPSLLHGGEDPSGLHNILSTSITPFDVGGICSWKMEMDFPLMTSFPFSALTVPWNLPWVESYWNMYTM